MQIIFYKILYFLIAIILLNIIVLYVSLWFIFKKQKIKPLYSLIPFYNIYIYFGICKIPFFTIFIPLVNLVALACAPYKLAKLYSLPKKLCISSFFIPFVILPFIAFSDYTMIENNEYEKTPIRTVQELEQIETKLTENSCNDYFFDNNKTELDLSENYKSKTDKAIEEIEENAIIDDYFFDNLDVNPFVKKSSRTDNKIQKQNDQEENIIDIFNQNYDYFFSANEIDELDENLANDANITKENIFQAKDYIKEGPSIQAIAFGGEYQKENLNKAIKEELKCPRCGSSLIGAGNSCPGCGMNLKNT